MSRAYAQPRFADSAIQLVRRTRCRRYPGFHPGAMMEAMGRDWRRSDIHSLLCLVLICGNLAFGTFAMLFPGLAGRLALEDEAAARAIGARDFRLGVDLLKARKPLPALTDGIVTDVGESAAWLKVKPLQALVP